MDYEGKAAKKKEDSRRQQSEEEHNVKESNGIRRKTS